MNKLSYLLKNYKTHDNKPKESTIKKKWKITTIIATQTNRGINSNKKIKLHKIKFILDVLKRMYEKKKLTIHTLYHLKIRMSQP